MQGVKTTKDILLESLKKFCTNSSGKCKNSFIEHWFTQNGKTYNFIFKQNLYVTNIQFRELIDLIQLNVTKGDDSPQINFMTTHKFIDLTSDIIESFIDEGKLKELREENGDISSISDNLSVICDNYINLFENTIVIDAFYTSCIVSIPSGLEIDIEQICFQSGYIHSCGENIYTRKMTKAKYESLVNRLDAYLQDYDKPLNFIMYTHEDYPIKNKLYVNDFQKHGLDEIKFYLEKFYMQDISLMQVAEDLQTNQKLDGKINVVNRTKAKKSRADECIWLIIDRSIGEDLKYPGEEQYYICYKQMYINENPFHIFDENKPGWINSVTIPHTLMGAMLNIGRAGCPNSGGEEFKVIDPFVGSGTTLLETLKYTDIDFEGGDLCEISQVIAEINLTFFAMDYISLNKTQKLILGYIKSLDPAMCTEISMELNLKDEDSKVLSDFAMAIYTAIRKYYSELKTEEKIFAEKFTVLANDLAQSILSDNVSKNVPISKKNIKIILQICLLLTWRTYKRNEIRYKNKEELPQTFKEDVAEEFKGFLYRLLSLIHLRKRYKNDTIIKSDDGRVIIYSGKYTKACSINNEFIKNSIDSSTKIKQKVDVIDFLNGFKGGTVDLIITDPPYGFNTIEEKKSFSKLYIAFINAMVKALRNGGQIIMCLPARSHSGKTVNVFAQKEVVSRQFMIAAQENGKYMSERKENLAEPKQLYTFPFYWDSEKALKRDIVRFQFFNKD